MKKIILLTVFTLIVNAGFVFGQSRSMAVMPFEIVGNAVTEAEAEGITELYISELVSTGKISIVDRANFDKILKEMNFQNSDWSDSEKTAQLGKATNAQFISRGKIIKLGSKMYLSSTVIDVTTAKVVSSGRKEFEDIDAAFAILNGFAKDVVDGMTYKCYDIGSGGGIVFKIQGTTVYEVMVLPDQADWYSAIEIAASYNGGGYTDWSLPTITESEWIQYALRWDFHGKLENFHDKTFWSRDAYTDDNTRAYTYYYWGYGSFDRSYTSHKNSINQICVIRKFIQE